MLLTEKEARDAPCIGPVGCGENRDGPFGPRNYCMASGCKLAWRWKGEKAGHNLGYMMQKYGAEQGRREWDAFCKSNPLKGFCGLAGRPDQ